MLISSSCLLSNSSLPCGNIPVQPRLGNHLACRNNAAHSLVDDYEMQNGSLLGCEERLGRRLLLSVSISSVLLPALPCYGKSKSKNPYDERRLLEQNKRVQRENSAPDGFPSFIREGFAVKVVASDSYVKRDSGLLYRDFKVGDGDFPKAGQQVTFHYIGYYLAVALTALIYKDLLLKSAWTLTGFEEGIQDMRPGGKRRIIIPPELGPPVGPSTFFSAKQFEVFDVELLGVKDCERTIGFYSDVVCT